MIATETTDNCGRPGRGHRRRGLLMLVAAAIVGGVSAVPELALGATPLIDVELGRSGEVSARENALVKEFVQKGITAYRQEKYEDAWNAIDRAWQVKRSVVVASLLAEIEMKLGWFDRAAFHWDYALKNLPPDASDARAEARIGLDECAKHTGVVTVTMDPSDATFVLDGNEKELSNPEGQIWVLPGMHTATFETRHGETSPNMLFTAVAGEALSIDLHLPRKVAPEPTMPRTAVMRQPPMPSSSSAVNRRQPAKVIVAMTGGSLTSISLGLTAWYGIRRMQLGSDIDSIDAALATLPSKSPCAPNQGKQIPACTELETKLHDYNDATQRTNAFLALSAGLGVVTVATYLLWPKQPRTVAVLPELASGFQGVTLQGRF